MATPSADEAVKVQTVLDFLKGTFPGQSSAIPEHRVLRAIQENGGDQMAAYDELSEEMQRSSWEVTGKKNKPKATGGSNAAATSAPAGRGRGAGGRGRGEDRGGRTQEGPVREYRGESKDDMGRGGMRGGRGGVRGGGMGRAVGGRPQDGAIGVAMAAPMPTMSQVPQPQPAPVAAAAPPPAAPCVVSDAPPVANQWNKGRPKTQEEVTKPPVPEKQPMKQQATGPVWNGPQQSKPLASTSQMQSQGGEAASMAPMPSAPSPAQQHGGAVQQQVSSAGGQQMKQAAVLPTPSQPAASQFDQMTQSMSHATLSDSNGQMQSMQARQASPKKSGLSEQSASSALGQQESMGHEYGAQFSAPNASTQQYPGQMPPSALQFQQYQQQQAPVPGVGQGQDDMYSEGSRGGYNQLDAFSGGMSDKGYGGHGGYGAAGKPYGGGKGGAGGAAGQNAAGQMSNMQQNWQQQQQQQQQNMMGAGSWMNNPYMQYQGMPSNMNNMANFAMYMQQNPYSQYPMQMFQQMANAQGGIGNAGGGQSQGSGGGGGGGKGFSNKGKGGGSGQGGYNNQNYNNLSSNFGYGTPDPNANSAQGGYGGYGGFPPPSYDSSSMGSMAYGQGSYDSQMGSLGYNAQQGAGSNSSSGMGGYPNTGNYSSFQPNQVPQQAGWEAPH